MTSNAFYAFLAQISPVMWGDQLMAPKHSLLNQPLAQNGIKGKMAVSQIAINPMGFDQQAAPFAEAYLSSRVPGATGIPGGETAGNSLLTSSENPYEHVSISGWNWLFWLNALRNRTNGSNLFSTYPENPLHPLSLKEHTKFHSSASSALTPASELEALSFHEDPAHWQQWEQASAVLVPDLLRKPKKLSAPSLSTITEPTEETSLSDCPLVEKEANHFKLSAQSKVKKRFNAEKEDEKLALQEEKPFQPLPSVFLGAVTASAYLLSSTTLNTAMLTMAGAFAWLSLGGAAGLTVMNLIKSSGLFGRGSTYRFRIEDFLRQWGFIFAAGAVVLLAYTFTHHVFY